MNQRAPDKGTRWGSTRDARAHLGGLSVHTLTHLMADTERAQLARPWVNIGRGKRATWKWKLDELDAWVAAVSAWRAGEEIAASARAGRATDKRTARGPWAPRGIRAPGKGGKAGKGGGRLKALAKTLTAPK